MFLSQENACFSTSEWTSVSAVNRFDDFINQATTLFEVWLIRDDAGFVQLALDEGACLPVWSSEDQALLWCQGEWQDCRVEKIELKEWLDAWLVNMGKHQAMLSVDPQPEADAFVVEAEDLRFSLLNALADNDQLEIAMSINS